MFLCEYCEIFNKTYFEEHPETAASNTTTLLKIMRKFMFHTLRKRTILAKYELWKLIIFWNIEKYERMSFLNIIFSESLELHWSVPLDEMRMWLVLFKFFVWCRLMKRLSCFHTIQALTLKLKYKITCKLLPGYGNCSIRAIM